MQRPAILALGAVVTALILAAGAVTVASALTRPSPATQVLEDDGVDTSATSPAPAPAGSPAPPASSGRGETDGSVVAVPPAGPVVLGGHGDQGAPGEGTSAPDTPGAGDDVGAPSGDPGADDSPGTGGSTPTPDPTPGVHDRNGQGHGQGWRDGSGDGAHGDEQR